MSLSQHPGACVAWPGSWHNSLDKQVWGEGGVLDCCWEACVSGREEMDCVPVCVLMRVRACVCVWRRGGGTGSEKVISLDLICPFSNP